MYKMPSTAKKSFMVKFEQTSGRKSVGGMYKNTQTMEPEKPGRSKKIFQQKYTSTLQKDHRPVFKPTRVSSGLMSDALNHQPDAAK